MTSAEEPESVRAECIFGSRRLLPLLDAFSKEIDGVKTAQDIEHIHRMRVASRRLRAALPLFVSCIPEKKYRHWMEGIQSITRALGNARDSDVQIEFLNTIIKKREPGLLRNDAPASTFAGSPYDVETSLLLQLKKKRSKLQTAVVSALENLENSAIIEEMRTFFTSQVKESKRRRKRSTPYGIPPVAANRISLRLTTLLSYEEWVHNPDAVTEHHAMRIAAKKLRYTMEVYAPVYRLGLKKYLFRVKKIQEILGDLHDCDVWIDTMMVRLLKERSKVSVRISSRNEQVRRVAGYKHFLAEREKERKRLYRHFVTYWDSLNRARIWDDLRTTLVGGRKRKYMLPVPLSEVSVRSSVDSLASQSPDVMTHSRTVVGLALSIFDGCAALHHLGTHERFLLECACSLHDIGWKFGQKGHAKRSAGMILSDGNLLLDVRDRGIIALVSRAHRGTVGFESDGIFTLLSPQERDMFLMLASILRIADGLDYSHDGLIKSVSCKIVPDAVVFEISALQDASVDSERARLKGDLFTRVFGRNLVIE